MGQFIGQLGTTTAAQRPPSFIQTNAISYGSFLDWTIGNYGREVAAFGNSFWATDITCNYWTTKNNYGRAAATFLNWATGINKWVTILDNWKQLQPRSGRLFYSLPLLFDQKSFKFLFFLHHNAKPANSTQNHYGCKAVSTSVASLFHLKRHKRFSSI